MNDRQTQRTAIVASAGCVIATLAAITVIAVSKTDETMVERNSYSQGWSNVVTRQPRHSILLGPNLDQPVPPLSDAAMVDFCRAYTENEGALLLDDVTDPVAYMQGCVDATERTSLEVER